MASYNKFDCFTQDLGRKIHNLNSDTLKAVLTNTAPSAANTVLSDITQIANGNGYTTDGATIANTSYSQTSGVAKLVGDDVVWTASGSMGPLRYVVIYNSTAAGKNLIGWWDRGASVTLISGDTFTSDFDQSAGILTNT